MSGDVLTSWVIYYGARNHPPGKWVTRPQDASCPTSLNPDGVRPHEVFFECDSLLEARAKVPPGLIRFDRHPSDDATIVETWL